MTNLTTTTGSPTARPSDRTAEAVDAMIDAAVEIMEAARESRFRNLIDPTQARIDRRAEASQVVASVLAIAAARCGALATWPANTNEAVR